MLTLSEIEIRHIQVIVQQVLNRPLNRNNTIRQSRPLSGRTQTQHLSYSYVSTISVFLITYAGTKKKLFY
jgi:hypothetical protein